MLTLFKRKNLFFEYGNEEDICHLCVEQINMDIIEKKYTSYEDVLNAKSKLKGKLDRIKIAKLRVSGRGVCICPECIAKINSNINPIEEEVEESQAVEEEVKEVKKGKANAKKSKSS